MFKVTFLKFETQIKRGYVYMGKERELEQVLSLSKPILTTDLEKLTYRNLESIWREFDAQV